MIRKEVKRILKICVFYFVSINLFAENIAIQRVIRYTRANIESYQGFSERCYKDGVINGKQKYSIGFGDNFYCHEILDEASKVYNHKIKELKVRETEINKVIDLQKIDLQKQKKNLKLLTNELQNFNLKSNLIDKVKRLCPVIICGNKYKKKYSKETILRAIKFTEQKIETINNEIQTNEILKRSTPVEFLQELNFKKELNDYITKALKDRKELDSKTIIQKISISKEEARTRRERHLKRDFRNFTKKQINKRSILKSNLPEDIIFKTMGFIYNKGETVFNLSPALSSLSRLERIIINDQSFTHKECLKMMYDFKKFLVDRRDPRTESEKKTMSSILERDKEYIMSIGYYAGCKFSSKDLTNFVAV